jgi:peptidoglycan-associated lipoprotein
VNQAQLGPNDLINSKYSNHLSREVAMVKKSISIIIFSICIGLILMGCPKKTVVKEEPSVKKEETAAAKAEAERIAKEREARLSEEAAKKDLEKGLVAKKEPGIEGVVFESSLLKDIYFEFDKYDIRPGDGVILKQNAEILKKYPKVKIQIEGHCDERGTNEYNLALGERRANSTKNYLISLGVPPERISTISYGEEKPLDPGHSEDAWAKNRRAHTIITAK